MITKISKKQYILQVPLSVRADHTTSGFVILSSVGDYQKAYTKNDCQRRSLRMQMQRTLDYLFYICYPITADGLNQVPEEQGFSKGAAAPFDVGNTSQSVGETLSP